MSDDPQATPRPQKRRRNSGNAPFLSAPPSPTKSDTTTEVESHRSGHLSPTKQLRHLEDRPERTVIFCNFHDDTEDNTPADVADMHEAMQKYADGVGIIGYPEGLGPPLQDLNRIDRHRFNYPLAHHPSRLQYGRMPLLSDIADLAAEARKLDQGPGKDEDTWNAEVHRPLLVLARKTSVHSTLINLEILWAWALDQTPCAETRARRTARIEPPTLASADLPRRVIDYAYTLQPDSAIKQAWRALKPVSPAVTKTWNHTLHVRKEPIVINIETKAPHKSWTDGKAQIAIWVDAWFQRLRLLQGCAQADLQFPTHPLRPPALPLLIAQGHDWHLLIVKLQDEKMVIRDQVAIGSTRNTFDAMKTLAALHWVIDWAQSVWRPWFVSWISGREGVSDTVDKSDRPIP